LAEAARSGPPVVAGTRENEEVHALGDGHDFVLDAPAPCLAPGRSPQPRFACSEQLVRSLVGDRAQPLLRRLVRRVATPQQAVTGYACDGLGLGARHVQQRYLGVAGQQRGGLVHGGLPGVFDDPDERAHLRSNLQPEP